MTAESDTLDRARGALLGLAVGDALGAAVEFCPRGTFDPVTGFRDGGPFDLPPGFWTDDTSMALCLADSLIACQGFDSRDQMDRYVRWWDEGYRSSTGQCFDIGRATSAALTRYEQTREPFSGSTDPSTAGNGSLMRLAPVPIFFRADLDECVARSADSSRTTHAARTCIDACRYFGALLWHAINRRSDSPDVPDLCPEIAQIAGGSFRRKQPPDIRGTGYVVESLEAALWAVERHSSFPDAVLAAVNLGDDADTTGAIAGQLAGARYGASAIPPEWLDRLVQANEIDRLARALHDRPEGTSRDR